MGRHAIATQKQVGRMTNEEFELFKKRIYMCGYRAGAKFENDRHDVIINHFCGLGVRGWVLRRALNWCKLYVK